jgi:hypothetical protein
MPCTLEAAHAFEAAGVTVAEAMLAQGVVQVSSGPACVPPHRRAAPRPACPTPPPSAAA